MNVQEAMGLIDAQVAAGATISIKNYPPSVYRLTTGPRAFPQTWMAKLGPVWVNGVPAHPSCTAYSQESAIVGIGEFLARVGGQS